MTDYAALRTELLAERRPAIVDGVFKGSMRQMLACAAASRVRSVIENLHAGVDAPDDAVVTWEGGSCPLHEAARFTPQWTASYACDMSKQLAEDIARFDGAQRSQDRDVGSEIQYALELCQKWVLPKADDKAMSDALPHAKAACYRPSGRLRPPEQRLQAFHIAQAYIVEFLAPWTKGNTDPAQASDSGEAVTVDLGGKIISWSDLGHLGDYDMMRFNIRLADTIYVGLKSIDKARQWKGEEAPLNLRLYHPHSFPP